MHRNLILSALLPLAFGLGALSRDGEPQGPLRLKGVIATVDLDRLAREFPMGAERMQALEKQAEDFKAKREADREALKKKEKGLQDLAEGTLERFEAEAAYQAEAEAWKSIQEARIGYLEYSQKRLSDEALMEVNKAIADIAKKSGIQLVLRHRDLPDAGKPDFKDPRRRLAWHEGRPVLYADPALDLTDEVIKVLKAVPTGPNK